MFYATCCDPAGAWSSPRGRCGELVLAHPQPGQSYLVLGTILGQGLRPDAVCGSLVCSGCGECQGGLKR